MGFGYKILAHKQRFSDIFLRRYKEELLNEKNLASRKPTSARYKVLGIGVAERVRTSTEVFIDAMRSFCFTPNL